MCLLHLSNLFWNAICLLFCCKKWMISFSHSPWLAKGREHSLHMLSATNRDLWGTTSAHEGLLSERDPYRWLGNQGSSTGHGARTGLCRLTIRLLLLCLIILIYCEHSNHGNSGTEENGFKRFFYWILIDLISLFLHSLF